MTYPPRPAPGRHQFPPDDNATSAANGYRPGSQPRYDTAGAADTWWHPQRAAAGGAGTQQQPAPPLQQQVRPEAPSWQPPFQGAADLPSAWRTPYAEEPVWPAPSHQRDGEALNPAVRGQIAERMIRMNTSHALAAADRLGTKTAVGPHSLALFSVDLVPGRYARLSTATRLVLDGEDADNLPELLHDLTARAYEKITEAREENRRWDPRTPLTGLVLRSEELTERTAYVGLGISTLDTPEIPWSRAKQGITGADGLHLRGQGMIYLNDGTAVHIVRRAQMAAGHHEIVANRRLECQYPSRRDDYLIEKAEQQGDRIWDMMRQLHEVLMTT